MSIQQDEKTILASCKVEQNEHRCQDEYIEKGIFVNIIHGCGYGSKIRHPYHVCSCNRMLSWK